MKSTMLDATRSIKKQRIIKRKISGAVIYTMIGMCIYATLEQDEYILLTCLVLIGVVNLALDCSAVNRSDI